MNSNKMEKLVIYGAGGFGRELACLINTLNQETKKWEMIGFIDDGLPAGHTNRYGKVLGDLAWLNRYPEKLAVVISVATPAILKKLTTRINNPNVWFPNIIAPDVKFHDADSVVMGMGNIIFSSCRISCEVKIGNFNILNSLVSLGHDVVIGDRNVLNPTVRISGECVVGNDNFFGLQSIILQGLEIGNNTRIGAASVVIKGTKDDCLYYGNPARLIKA